MKLKFIYFFLLILGCIQLNAQSTFGYKNPVIRGFNPDPSVCRVGNDFYLVTSSFEYFPGLPVYHSKDLINWTQIGYCLTRDSQLPLENARASEGLFAPSLRYHDGLFYVICTNVSGGGNFFCTATDPAEPWSEPTWVPIDSIDPDIFWDEDGKTYFVTQGNEGIRVTEVDLATGQPLAPERLVWGGIGGRYPEAPHIYKKDGYYYLLLGEGGTEYAHSATIGRSRDLFGPYESCPLNPILTHCNRIAQANQIQGVGHADFIQAPDGSWWTVFLGFRTLGLYSNFHILGRETFLAPVDWPEGGWPQVNGNGTVTLDMNVRTLLQYPVEQAPVRDNFDTEEFGMQWNWLRNPVRENYSLTEKKGYLRISASLASLDDATPLSFVGRRQTEFDFTATTQLLFESSAENEAAGITVQQNNRHHYDVQIRKKDNQYVVQLRARIGSMDYIAAEYPLAGNEVQLKIEGVPTQYTFSFADPANGQYKELGKMDTRYLSKEVADGFTGVMIGLFATSNGQPTQAKAYFDWFDYTTVNK